MDKYSNFAELEREELEGKDYIIHCRKTFSEIAIVAPHGGGIEPGTLDLADEIAGKEFSFYSLSGIKKRGNGVLHLKSIRFDEPKAIDMANNAYTVLTIHGCRDEDEVVYAGGKYNELKFAISAGLAGAGFNIKQIQYGELKGKCGDNICNRCRSGKGVQLEVSMGLRKRMFDPGCFFSSAERTEIFYSFVNSVRGVLLSEHKYYHDSFQPVM